MAENRQIQLRRDSVADWYSNNPTLASGEPGVETDTQRLRIGDGSTATTSLAVHQPIRTYAATGDVTLADSDDYTHIFVTTGATDRTITLPTAADNVNRQYVIKKVDSGTGTVTIDGEGAETIDQLTTFILSDMGQWVTIVCDGSEWQSVAWSSPPTMIVEDQKTSGTDGGTSSTSRSTRDLNTVVHNGISGASRSGNQIVLPAGTYEVEWWAPFHRTLQAVTWLHDATNSADLAQAQGYFSDSNSAGGDVQGKCVGVSAPFTFSAEANIQIDYECRTSFSGTGLGHSVADYTDATYEVYTRVRIKKVG